MLTYLKKVLGERGLPEDHVSAEDLQIFCKNANFLQVTHVRSLEQEMKEFKPEEDFSWDLHDKETCALWFVLQRCIEEFRDEKGYFAGLCDHNADSQQV